MTFPVSRWKPRALYEREDPAAFPYPKAYLEAPVSKRIRSGPGAIDAVVLAKGHAIRALGAIGDAHSLAALDSFASAFCDDAQLRRQAQLARDIVSSVVGRGD